MMPSELRAPYFRPGAQAVRRRRRWWPAPLLRLLRTGAVLAAPAVLTAWLLRASVFALHSFEAAGNQRVSYEWLTTELARFRGQNLFLLDLGELRRQLLRHPWVEGVRLRKQLPDRLSIEIAEHRPAALLRLGGQTFFISENGVLITRCEETALSADPSWLRLSGKAGKAQDHAPRPGERPEGAAGALQAVAELERAAPGWAARLAGVEILGSEDYRLSVEGLPFDLLVTAGTTEAKVRWLERLLPEIESQLGPVATVDLRFAGRIVLKPGAAAAGSVTGGESEDDSPDSDSHPKQTTDARGAATQAAGAGSEAT